MTNLHRIAVVGKVNDWIREESDRLGLSVSELPYDALLRPRALDHYAGVLIMEEPQESRGLYPRALNLVILWNLEAYALRGGQVFAEACYMDHDAYPRHFASCFGFSPEPLVRRCEAERVSVTSNHPALGLEAGLLLEEYRSFAVGGTLDGGELLASFGKFLGTYHVVDPLPAVTFPAMVRKCHGEGETIFSTFPLSRFEALTYRPKREWRQLASNLLAWAGRVQPVKLPKSDAPVIQRPKDRESRVAACRDAVAKNVAWFERSGVLIQPDGSGGVWEAVQPDCDEIRHQIRPDCNFQTALAFTLAAQSIDQIGLRDIGQSIAENLYTRDYQLKDKRSPAHGLWNWLSECDDERMVIFADDNSWAIISSFMLSSLLGHHYMMERGFHTADAFLRLRRRDGMIPACHDRRGNPITPFDLYYEDTEVFGSASPHFGGMVASALVAAYLCSGETNYLEAARLITNRLIEHMPDFSDVSRNCKSHAYARMLVPLAFLYRADGSRRWLDLAAEVDNYLADKQADCGAIYEWDHWDIREFRGDTGIFHENGEKIADLLYTNNFVLLNSWFAWKSTGEQRYLERFERVADFLMSIQIQSNDPKIDGGWMRGFDFGPQWDWYGSNQDTSWGPYAMETGWTNAPISMAFSMYVLDLDPFDLLCG